MQTKTREETKQYVLKMAEQHEAKFIQNKKIEWDHYRTQVTEYELKRYLPVL